MVVLAVGYWKRDADGGIQSVIEAIGEFFNRAT
jgi:hypothetical protein